MNAREIHSAMRRLFYGELHDAEPWRHIFAAENELDEAKCQSLLSEYIDTPDVLLYGGSAQSAIHCMLGEAVGHIGRMLQESKNVRVATPDFQARAVFNSVGVATGSKRKTNPTN